MSDVRTQHWDNVYAHKADDSVSWFEPSPLVSLSLIETSGIGKGAVIDIGGGASRLVDALIAKEHNHVAVLDLSAQALTIAKARLGALAQNVEWIVADVTQWQPAHRYALWHDRAAFHFLTDPDDQAAYARALDAALIPGGVAIIGTFAPDGPEKCSNLPVMRQNGESIAQILGPHFTLLKEHRYDHVTPGGSVQKFQFSRFRKAL